MTAQTYLSYRLAGQESCAQSTICSVALASTAGSAVLERPDEKKALLERILSNPNLPSPPSVAVQIVQKTKQPDCDTDEIVRLLALDSAICGKVLKTLNSALYGLSQPVTSLNRAVNILGLRPLRSLVLGLTLPAMQSGLDSDQGLRRYWRESVAGAILTQQLAKRLRYRNSEDDLVASLLRDLGTLFLRHTFKDMYDPWSGDAIRLGAEQCDWEVRNLGVHHGEVGAALLAGWGLPPEITEPIRLHHYPHLAADSADVIVQRARLLDFTSRLAQLDELPQSGLEFEELVQAASGQYGLGHKDLAHFLGEARTRIEDFAAILKVDIGKSPCFAEVLAAGCEELIRLSVEKVADSTCAPGETRPSNADLVIRGEARKKGDDARATTTLAVDDLSEEFFARLDGQESRPQIQQYELLDWIGRGAMGVVVKAYDPGLGRTVALKFLAPELADHRNSRQRFSLEARFAAALRSHHVVATYAVSEMDGIPFMVMEYVAGKSLGDRLERGDTFSTSEIGRIAAQAAAGLAAAHELRLVHRDIKPDNLLMEETSKRILVSDFGLVRVMDQDFQVSQSGQMVGTPLFMSPEQVDGDSLTPSSDLFSLGSVLYVLCTGRLPFAAETLSGLICAIATQDPAPVQELNPAVPDWLAYLVKKLHAKDPKSRFPSASAVVEYCRNRTGSGSGLRVGAH